MDDISQEAVDLITKARPAEVEAQPQTPVVEEQKSEDVATTPEPTEPKPEAKASDSTEGKKKGGTPISQLIDIKRQNRELRQALRQDDVETQTQEPEVPNMDELKQRIKEEMLEELKPQLSELEALKEENDKFRTEKAEAKLNIILKGEIEEFVKEFPHAELAIDQEHLFNLLQSNPKLADLTGRELIMKAFPKATQAPKIDSYGFNGKNTPKPVDFAKADGEDYTRITKDKGLQDKYLQHLIQNR